MLAYNWQKSLPLDYHDDEGLCVHTLHCLPHGCVVRMMPKAVCLLISTERKFGEIQRVATD